MQFPPSQPQREAPKSPLIRWCGGQLTEVGVERVRAVRGPLGEAAGDGVLSRVHELPQKVRPHKLVRPQQLTGRGGGGKSEVTGR